jgi:hypothetical protein
MKIIDFSVCESMAVLLRCLGGTVRWNWRIEVTMVLFGQTDMTDRGGLSRTVNTICGSTFGSGMDGSARLSEQWTDLQMRCI